MLRLVLGKLYDGAAILPGKLDERIRRIASAVNGGLTGANLDPAYKIPLSRFQHQFSRFSLQARFPGTEISSGLALFAVCAPVPAQCRIERIDVFWSYDTASYGDFQFWKGTLYGVQTQINYIATYPEERMVSTQYPAVAAGQTMRRKTYVFNRADAGAVIDAGRHLWLKWPYADGVKKIDGHAVFTFIVNHSA